MLKHEKRVSIYSRSGFDISSRVPDLVEICGRFKARSLLIDGELIRLAESGAVDFLALQSTMLRRRAEHVSLAAFDLLHINGTDLRREPLLARKARLHRVTDKAAGDIMFVDHFPDGAALLVIADEMGIEGVVSKREGAGYQSGRSRLWVKVKTPAWLEFNKERWQKFAGITQSSA